MVRNMVARERYVRRARRTITKETVNISPCVITSEAPKPKTVKELVIEASFIRNRAVLDELAKH